MKLVYLSGGVGGARLLRGLVDQLGPDELTVVVNTGDDFDHWGLRICPDLDTVMYNMAGLAHEERGWGLSQESFAALSMMQRYGSDTWFALGDRDLATHLTRSEALRAGHSLTSVTARLATALGVDHPILPMCDAPVATTIDTRDGRSLPFQTWFVRERCEPAVRAVRYLGASEPSEPVLDALGRCDAVLIGPSNPYVSIDPILSVPKTRTAVFARPVIAVSPIVAGAAIKGPLASMIEQIAKRPSSAGAIARHYLAQGPLSGIVVERGDEANVEGVRAFGAATVMRSRDESRVLAARCLDVTTRFLQRT